MRPLRRRAPLLVPLLAVLMPACDEDHSMRAVRPADAQPGAGLRLGEVDLESLAPYGIDALEVEDDHIGFLDLQGYTVGGATLSAEDGRIAVTLGDARLETFFASEERLALICDDTMVELDAGARLDDLARTLLDPCAEASAVSSVILAALDTRPPDTGTSLVPAPAQEAHEADEQSHCLLDTETCWQHRAGHCAAPITCLIDTCDNWQACHPTP